MLWPEIIGLVIALLLSWLAYRLGTHALSGLLLVVGCYLVAILGGGWVWGALVLVYFACTIAGYRLGQRNKAVPLNRLLGRARIDWRHVVGQLGWSCVVAIIAWLGRPNVTLTSAFAGVVAAAVGDSWATELGVLGRPEPRRITDGKRVPVGTPGAVSLLGLLSAAGGAWLVGYIAMASHFVVGLTDYLRWTDALFWLPIGATLGGLAGTVLDSFLGATAQGMYYCDHCQQPSEESVHSCELPARQVSGWRWLTNQGVDLAASLVGAAVTATIVLLASLSL